MKGIECGICTYEGGDVAKQIEYLPGGCMRTNLVRAVQRLPPATPAPIHARSQQQ